MKEKKILLWRFVILLAILLLMATGCMVYVVIDGNTFTAKTIYFDAANIPEEDVRLEVENPNIVAVDGFRLSEYHLHVDVHALNSGSTTISAYFRLRDTDYAEEDIRDIPLYVNDLGTVFQIDSLNFDGFLQAEIVIIGGLVLVALFTGYTFIEALFKARFTYSTVACGGVAMFTLFMSILSIIDLNLLSDYNTFRTFLLGIADTGFDFCAYVTPVMLLMTLVIAVSNIWLLRHEGRRLHNMLGIILALGWLLSYASIFALVFLILYGDGIISSLSYRLAYFIGYVLSFLECLLLSTIVSAFFSSKYKPPYNKDYLIILGCGIRKDGTLTPILRGRADAAIRFERAQFAATGKHAVFIPSGGQGADEVISESEAIKRYLMEQGYPEEQILKEDKSVNTDQNIRFSRDRILQAAGTLDNIKAAFATTNYHIFRGYILSKKHKLDAQGISAKTKWYFFPNAFLREFAGLLYAKKWFIIASVLILLIVYYIGSRYLLAFN